MAMQVNSQTGTCGSPKPVTDGTCTSQDTFNLAPYYAKFTAATDTTQYTIRVYIQGLSTHPNYSVKLYKDSCANLVALPISSNTDGDTVYVRPQFIIGGLGYLIEMKNNNTSPSSKTYFSICMTSAPGPSRNVCPSTYYGNPIGCNLICNGDFECISTPFGGDENLQNLCGWFNGNGGSCDAFSTTSTVAIVGVPCNEVGYEPAQSGNGYAGFIAKDPTYPFQEYMETKLTSPLVAGQLYFGSLWVSLADKSPVFPNNISIYFTNVAHIEPGTVAYTITPAISLTTTPTWSNQVGWTNLTFTYVPVSSGAQYIIIGQDGTSTYAGSATTGCPAYLTSQPYAYVYIDNISLVKGPSLNVISPICSSMPATFSVTCPLASTTFSWSWGDSSPNYTTTVPSASHTYTAAGTYTAILYSLVPGNTYTTSAVVTVTAPTASFSYATNCSSTTFSAAPTCSTSTMYYSWQFGDGGSYSSTSNTASYTYTSAGTYIATLTVNWDPTTSWTGTTSITVQQTPSITINSSGGSLCASNNQTFTAVVNPSGSYSYSWSATAGTITAGTQTTSALGMNFTGISSTAVLTLSLTGISCSTTATYSVFPCCTTAGATSVFPSGYTFTTTTTYTSGIYVLNNATIASGVQVKFQGCEVKMNPNALLQAGSNSTLYVLTSYVHGCNAQWNSITTAPGSTIHIEGSIIEDAQRVVVDSTGSGKLYAFNSIFNRNYKGFVFVNPTTSLTLDIKNNAFINADLTGSAISYAVPVALTPSVVNAAGTYSALPGLNLLPPYSTITAKTGMECVKTQSTTSSYIKLGHSITNAPIGNSNQNIFHKLSEGIAAYNSKVQVLNQYFQYCTIAPNASGVYVYGSPLASGISDVKIGTATTEKSYFYSNTNGVLSTLPSALNVQRCSFVDNTKGIYVNNNFKNKLATVSTNTFTNNDLGVKMENNVWIDGQLTSNTFTNSVARATYANNYAIYISEAAAPTPTNVANYYVFSNTIDGYYNGIFVSNTYSSSILTNSITVRASTVAATYQEGIEITLCNLPTVKLNTIAISGGTYTANWQNGILTNANTLPSVLCNSVSGLGSCITIQGYNWTSANGGGYCGNIFNNFGYGIWMDMSAEIGDQYFYNTSTKYASDNQWLTALSGSKRTNVTGMSNNIFATGAKLYTRGAPTQYSISAAFDALPTGPSCQPAFGCALLGTNNSGTVSNACTGGGGGGSAPMSLSTPTIDIIQPALDIAQGNLSALQSNDNLLWLNKRSLYQNLILQDINTSSYPDLTSFKNKVSGSNIGKLHSVDIALNDAVTNNSKNSLANASALNNSINALNLIEWNQKTVNNIYISYLNNDYKLDDTQVGDLDKIAEQCPLTNGNAVYQARSLVFNYTGKKYISTCEHTSTNDLQAAANRLANNPGLSSIENDIKVYPNPGSEEIFVETGSYNNCEFVMYNLLGQEVVKQPITSFTKIDINYLNNGTYFYRIIQGENVIKRDKLIVVH